MIVVDTLLIFSPGLYDLKYYHVLFILERDLIKPASGMNKYIVIGVEIV